MPWVNSFVALSWLLGVTQSLHFSGFKDVFWQLCTFKFINNFNFAYLDLLNSHCLAIHWNSGLLLTRLSRKVSGCHRKILFGLSTKSMYLWIHLRSFVHTYVCAHFPENPCIIIFIFFVLKNEKMSKKVTFSLGGFSAFSSALQIKKIYGFGFSGKLEKWPFWVKIDPNLA